MRKQTNPNTENVQYKSEGAKAGVEMGLNEAKDIKGLDPAQTTQGKDEKPKMTSGTVKGRSGKTFHWK